MSNLMLGVDIGASNIKIIELKEKKGRYTVKNILLGRTPERALVEGSILDHGAVAKAVADTVSSTKGLTKEACVALHGRDVVVKKVALPWNGKGDFKEQFLWSAEQYIGMSSEKASFDAQMLKYDMETQLADTVLAAAPKDKVADMLTASVQAGLNPVVVDLESLALVNLVTKFKGKQDHVNVIIDMGHDAVQLIFYENGHVETVKIIYKGGKFLIEEIAQDLSVEPEKAAEMLRDSDAVQENADIQAAAMAYGSSLGSEIETNVDIYMQEHNKEPVDFYVCGATAYVSEVVENVETSMGVSMAYIDPFRYIEIPANLRPVVDSVGAGTFALAAALGMREA